MCGRSPEEIYAYLAAEIDAAHRSGAAFSACKEDVEKAFPSIRIEIALLVLERCGLPPGMIPT